MSFKKQILCHFINLDNGLNEVLILVDVTFFEIGFLTYFFYGIMLL